MKIIMLSSRQGVALDGGVKFYERGSVWEDDRNGYAFFNKGWAALWTPELEADIKEDIIKKEDEAIAYMNYWQSVPYPEIPMSKEQWRCQLS